MCAPRASRRTLTAVCASFPPGSARLLELRPNCSKASLTSGGGLARRSQTRNVACDHQGRDGAARSRTSFEPRGRRSDQMACAAPPEERGARRVRQARSVPARHGDAAKPKLRRPTDGGPGGSLRASGCGSGFLGVYDTHSDAEDERRRARSRRRRPGRSLPAKSTIKAVGARGERPAPRASLVLPK